MDESFSQTPSPELATQLYSRAADLEKKGQYEIALREYRRAVLAQPDHVKSLVAIGRLCRRKGESENSPFVSFP